MAPETSLACSQQLATGPYPEPMNPIHTFPPYFPKIHSHIILPSLPRSSEWSLPFRFSENFYSYTFCIMSCTSLIVSGHSWHFTVVLFIDQDEANSDTC